MIFEFEKNKLIVEEFIEEKTGRAKPKIEIGQNRNADKAYAVLFPGAGEVQKQWSYENFAAIADELKNTYDLDVKICGSSTDSELANRIISTCKSAAPINLCGKTSLINLIIEISNATFLFTNDSSALHIAACSNTKTICVLNGRHFGRFAPYPKNIFNNAVFVFPDEMDKLILEDFNFASAKTKNQSIATIDSISIEKVKAAIKIMLS